MKVEEKKKLAPKEIDQPPKKIEFVAMRRNRVVFDAPKEDIPNMLKNGWEIAK
jgi:hypothetical protein